VVSGRWWHVVAAVVWFVSADNAISRVLDGAIGSMSPLLITAPLSLCAKDLYMRICMTHETIR